MADPVTVGLSNRGDDVADRMRWGDAETSGSCPIAAVRRDWHHGRGALLIVRYGGVVNRSLNRFGLVEVSVGTLSCLLR